MQAKTSRITGLSASVKNITKDQEQANVVQAVHEFLADACTNAELDWQIKVFRPLLDTQLRILEERFRADFIELSARVREAQLRMSASVTGNEEILSGRGRVLRRAGNARVRTLPSGTKASISRESLKIVRMSTAVKAGAAVPNPLWHLTFIPLLTAGGAMDWIGNAHIKRQIGVSFRDRLKAATHLRAADYANSLGLSQLTTEWNKILDAMISVARTQVENALREMKHGERSVSAERARLSKLSEKINQIDFLCTTLLDEISVEN
jgi:hypothetical protein